MRALIGLHEQPHSESSHDPAHGLGPMTRLMKPPMNTHESSQGTPREPRHETKLMSRRTSLTRSGEPAHEASRAGSWVPMRPHEPAHEAY